MKHFALGVALQEGSPMLKLACNRDENPYVVADRFIEEHGLPMEFKSQVGHGSKGFRAG
jgi:phospholipase A-2-activating protein